jgi:hypothetical protein
MGNVLRTLPSSTGSGWYEVRNNNSDHTEKRRVRVYDRSGMDAYGNTPAPPIPAIARAIINSVMFRANPQHLFGGIRSFFLRSRRSDLPCRNPEDGICEKHAFFSTEYVGQVGIQWPKIIELSTSENPEYLHEAG